ncbi:class I SAM-dependent methyltransferase [Ideonella livida]|uniref:Class I SAM-dependent methyltransferase n=1 Tax=Ideonella livida TaxID=2707176 RepID=A0A7C9PIF1_9BURK|nr:class I SAM-dependent methyltransferase [Ideonella livida]NDY92797.1 class I SAM-dependent methyltransferase [Ideonella livida]
MSAFWNERFAAPGFKYGTAPNAFLRAQAPALLPPGAQVLVPGDGEGRNGVWLAAQGHQVLAVDASDVGLAKASQLAAAQGCATHYATQVADLAQWAPVPDTWDAVVLVYTHLPSSFRQQAHRALAQGLKPGGVLLLEAFHPTQWTELQGASGGPREVDMLYPLATLQADFSDLLEELHGEETETTLDEGPGHQGLARVTRWVGRRR